MSKGRSSVKYTQTTILNRIVEKGCTVEFLFVTPYDQFRSELNKKDPTDPFEHI